MTRHQQQERRGWPLGLRPLASTRAAEGGVLLLRRRRRNLEFSGSGCTFIMSADSQTSCTDSSSDLDSESTAGSFFPDRSMTLGRLMGIAGFVELPRRSNMGGTTQEEPPPGGGGDGDDDDYDSSNTNNNKTQKASACWLLSLCFSSSCSGALVDDGGGPGKKKTTPCLADFLALERRNDYSLFSDAVPLT